MSSKKIRAWIPVWAIIIASVLIAFEYGKVPPAAPNMMEVLGISYTTQGLMMTMFSHGGRRDGAVRRRAHGPLRRAGRWSSIALGSCPWWATSSGLFWTSDAGILVTRALEGCGYGAAR